MNGGLYVAGSGVKAAMAAEASVAQDLANTDTPGYEALVPTLQPWATTQLLSGGPVPAVLGRIASGAAAGTAVDAAPGVGATTPDPLAAYPAAADVYFTVATPAGVRYTRDGQFEQAHGGTVQTPDGAAVMDTAGRPVLAPAGSRLLADGTVVGPDGKPVDRLGLVTLANPQPAGRGLYTGAAVPAPAATLIPGRLEQSNVSLSWAVGQLVAAQRLLGACAQAVQAQNGADTALQSEVG